MRPENLHAREGESGRASLEFLTAAIVVLIPIMFLALSLSSIQNAMLATESAARAASRVFVTETSLSQAAARAERAVVVALANHGIDSVDSLERSCSRSSCLTPGTVVTIRVGVMAPLFSSDLLPGFLGEATIPVFAEAHSMVSVYGGAP
jgi:hypothetical protein